MPKVKGVAPGFLLLPAREYDWELKKKIELRLPLKGTIKGLMQSNFDEVQIAGDNEFSIFEDNLFLLWEVVRVLFANSSYPELKDNECLNVVAFEFDLPKNEAVLYGEVIRSVSSGEGLK